MEDGMLKSGTLLYHDNYRIEKVIGKGGFGITYLATDISLSRKVAIKEFFQSVFCGRSEGANTITCSLPINQKAFETLREKFIKEAKNIAKLSHPYIIKIYSQFEENNTAYYAMEYIEGESINEKVKARGPLPVEEAITYIEKIGSAIDYLHKNHMTHLDIKPANIMVRRSDNAPILIDFGLSKNYDKTGLQTTTTATMGISPGYSPVEQYTAQGINEFSPKTDIYALGATFYFMLTGNVPPEPMTLETDGIVFPYFIPSNIKEAIENAMAFKREQRYETVEDFIRQIKKVESEKVNEDSEATKIIEDSEATKVIKKPESKKISNNTAYREAPTAANNQKIIYTEPTGNSQSPVKKKNNYLFAILGGVVILAIVGFLIVFFASDNGHRRNRNSQRSEDYDEANILESRVGNTSYNNNGGLTDAELRAMCILTPERIENVIKNNKNTASLNTVRRLYEKACLASLYDDSESSASYPMKSFEILSQDDDKAEIKVYYTDRYNSSGASYHVTLRKQKIVDDGNEEYVWDIDEISGHPINSKNRSTMVNYINGTYNDIKAYGTNLDYLSSIIDPEFLDYEETVDYLTKIEDFVQSMDQHFPDGKAK